MLSSSLIGESFDFGEFVQLIHGHDSKCRAAGLMIVAYCDESGDIREPAVYSVSGMLGMSREWIDLERRWKVMLKKHHLEATGFHMASCESGTKDPYRLPRENRWQMQRDFIGVINDTPLFGYASAIDSRDFPGIRAALAPENFAFKVKEYYPAFQYTVKWLATMLDSVGVRRAEKVAFIFDQQAEFQSNAKQVYDFIRDESEISYRHRLGSISFGDRRDILQLQAADVFAYESMRFVREVVIRGDAPRWQYDLLCSARQRDEIGFALLDVNEQPKSL